MDKWRNKNAVVTGSSSGIGRAILKELVTKGINVIGLARHTEKFLPIIEEMSRAPGKIHVHQCDVASAESVETAFEWIDETIGAVDILINCAGIFRFVNVLGAGDNLNSDLRETIEVNLMGAVYCAREAYKSMTKHDNYGIILNINSVGGHYVPLPRAELTSLNTYSPSKHGITALTEVLRHELTWMKNNKIRVSSLSPGETRTEICDNSTNSNTTEEYYSKNPSLDPENVASGVSFILSLPLTVQVSELTMRCVGARV